MLVYWIWLAGKSKLGEKARLGLMERFQDPEKLYYADEELLKTVEGLSEEGLAALMDKDLSSAEEILARCQQQRIHLLTIVDAAYPRRLRNIFDAPMVLYYKGTLPDFDRTPTIGVVGTRRASAYGLTAAKRLGYQIAKCGGLVVSGMAAGIDSAAMSAALTAGQSVVGVLGCGVDVVYPPFNRGLYDDTERYGCLLSELPPGTQPTRWSFPRRNRIISGLSCGVLVVEAPEHSGALITARLALEQGRDVFAVPGNIDTDSCAGSNALLRDGAIVAASGWDVMQEYEGLYRDKIHRDETPVRMTAYPDEVARAQTEEDLRKGKKQAKTAEKPRDAKKIQNLTIDNPCSGPYSDVDITAIPLSEEERKILKSLDGGERAVDEVTVETELRVGKFLAAMTMLEMKGLLRRLPGKRIAAVVPRGK